MPATNANLVYTCEPWEVDLVRRELRSSGTAVPLGERAFQIVGVLVQSATELVTKDELMERVWPGGIVGENTLHVHISAVRKALGPDRGMLKTKSGRGYRLLGDWTPRHISPSPGSAALEASRAAPLPFRSTLPSVPTDLIGRAADVLHLRDSLSAYRAVTLTGPGGIGKTTLALEVARSLFPTFQGDGCMVELAALTDPGLVPTAVAGALGLRLGGDVISPEAVGRAIGDRKLLLLIDNCEHVVDAAAQMAETLLRLCRGATVLATSREDLRIEGEHVYRVPPLDVPHQDQVDPGGLLGHSAVQLFIARTKALGFEFLQHGNDLRAVAGICRRLDGIPLAIEFAAARAATLGILQLASGLDDRFGLLTGGRRTALPRHRTLRATLDWSYELLPEAERRLLRHLAVFPAGFMLDAAAAVMSDARSSGSSAADGVSSLMSKSFVTLEEASSGGRWRLLETIRAYALEKLIESGEAEATARRHAEFFRDLIAPTTSASPLQPASDDMVRYGREIDNVRAALDWSFSTVGDSTTGIVLTAAYAPVWLNFALMVECRERIERALHSLEPASNLSPRLLMQLHLALGISLMITMGSVERTREILTTAINVAASSSDVDAQLRTLWALWSLDFNIGECRSAQSIVERFSHLAHHTRDPISALAADRMKGFTLQYAGTLHEARECLERVLDRYVAPTDQQNRIWFLYDQHVLARSMLARILWLQGYVIQAVSQAQASLEEAQASGNKVSLCWALRYGVCPIALMSDNLADVEQAGAMLIDVATSHNAAFWKILGWCMEGSLLIKRGEFKVGSIRLRTALDACDSTGWMVFFPEFLCVLAEGLAGLGQLTEALATVNQALARADHGGERWYVAELLRIKGDLLFRKAVGESISAAETCFHEALEVARQQGALSLELRSALSLARLRIKQDRQSEARLLLAPVYDRFTEGFETADLRSARALCETLAP